MSQTHDLTGCRAEWGERDRAAGGHLIAAIYDDLRRIARRRHIALTRLAGVYPPQAQLVDLRFFDGLSLEEAAEVLDRSPASFERDWTVARAWLFREVGRVRHDERPRGTLPDARRATSGDR